VSELETGSARRRTQERTERLLGPQHEVVISDARAIRALAHEARQSVIQVLYTEQRPRTSTELAQLTGLSPSAMSYHLRALEKWGVVERSAGGEDGRNRPWKASGTGLRIDTSGLGPAGEDLIADRLIGDLRQRLVLVLRPERRLVLQLQVHRVLQGRGPRAGAATGDEIRRPRDVP
jgi:DNA-binding MarR family transcriptional regulator